MFDSYRDLFLRRDHFEVRLANSAQWIDDEVSKAVRKKEGLRKKARKILLLTPLSNISKVPCGT